MNAAAKELPVSYDLSKPQEDREPYVGSVLFFKHVIFTVTLLLILIPTTLSIYLFAQVRSLNRQLDTAGSQLAAMQEQLPSTAPEGGEPTPAEPEPPAAEVPAYTELYPELYADDSLRGTVDVDNAVYLTFDDGPSARTDEILEILDKYGVKATFFVVGANEEGDLERMQKIVAAGHTLAIHSYSHDYKKIYASVEAYLEDFNQMFCQIYEATGVKPQIFRFPGGSVNSYNVGIHQQLIAEMTRRGFVYFDWNVANGDAVFSKIQPSSTLTANALKGVGTARRAIILMHDSSAKTTTVEALPAIIEGYGQTTLSNHKAERSGALLIKEATRKGYQEAAPGDSVDLGYPGSATRAGRVGVGVAHDAASVQGIVERGGRIRRLMPRECLRLQGFDDEQIDKILAINSDAQAYKQAGNSVTVTVIEAIGRRIRAVDEALRKEAAA